MQGALAFVSMPGLVAVTVGLFLGAAGALLLIVAIGALAVSARYARLRAPAAAGAVAGLIVALSGAGLLVWGDAASDGEVPDAVSPVLALFALGVATVAGRVVARALRRPPVPHRS